MSLMVILTAAPHQVASLQKPLPAFMAILVGLAAFAVVALQGLWEIAQHFNTIAHEGAHALVRFGAGQRITGIELNANGTGLTEHVSRGREVQFAGPFVGYIGPSAFGLILAKMISLGEIVSALWLTVAVLAILLPLITTGFGRVYVIATGGVLFLIARYSTAGIETVVAYGLAWFFLLSGIRVVLVHRWKAKDAGNLRNYTHLPTLLWALLWLILTVAALAKGGSLLV
jgi:hypothetical protein